MFGYLCADGITLRAIMDLNVMMSQDHYVHIVHHATKLDKIYTHMKFDCSVIGMINQTARQIFVTGEATRTSFLYYTLSV